MTATITFPDSTTATLVDQHNNHRYVDFVDGVRMWIRTDRNKGFALGTELAEAIATYSRTVDESESFPLAPENRAALDRLAALAPGQVVRVTFS